MSADPPTFGRSAHERYAQAKHFYEGTDLSRFDRASWYAASARGFEAGDHAAMRDCILVALTREV